MTDQMICRAFDVAPLPGADDRMWRKIDEKLRERGKEGWILYGKRRSPLPVMLAATLVVVAALLVIFFVRRLPANSPMEPLPAATPVPEEEVETAYRSDMREIRLINARVDGMSSLRIAEAGRFLARAVLPEGMAVDHWLLNGEPTDAGDRRFSLEFDSEGVDTVEAVLREELTVRCGDDAYLQFLDENGEPAGVKYDSIGFEFDYTVPLTGESHPGGTISVMALPIIPLEWELDYWLIDGEKVEAEDAAKGILLQDMDHSITIDAVLIKGWVITPTGETLVLQGDGDAGLSAGPADDRPADLDAVPVNGYWEPTDILKAGVPFDPTLPAPDGHTHQWEFEKNITETSAQFGDSGYRGGDLYICTECGWEYLNESIWVQALNRNELRCRLFSVGSLGDTGDEAPFDPDAPAEDGHIHQWVYQYAEWASCRERNAEIYQCSICAKTYRQEGRMGDHQYEYVNWGDVHIVRCKVCGEETGFMPHSWVHSGNSGTQEIWVCDLCGAVRYEESDAP